MENCKLCLYVGYLMERTRSILFFSKVPLAFAPMTRRIILKLEVAQFDPRRNINEVQRINGMLSVIAYFWANHSSMTQV
ncbi:hypothetical protein PM082_016911 [Marasmius tenuissimus]|nr:hypothetical protein PM082_016911 [Marasmius tenuissimus]